MAYTPTTWATGDIVTAALMNKLENGVAAIEGLPAVTSSDNGKVLMVDNGAWTAATIPSANGEEF